MENEQKPAILTGDADRRISDYSYLKTLTQEEIRKEEDVLIDLAVKISDLETDFKSVKIEHKAKIDPVKKDYATTLDNIRSGKKLVSEEVFIFFDRAKKIADYYNSEGILVYSRSMEIEEHQMTIYNDANFKG